MTEQRQVGTTAVCRHCTQHIIWQPWFLDGKQPNPPVWSHIHSGVKSCSSRSAGAPKSDLWPFAEPPSTASTSTETEDYMPRPLTPGDIIHGFAYGAFGRDHYHCVRIEAVGPDWIVARDPDRDGEDDPSFASGRRSLELCQEARDKPCPNNSLCLLADARPPLTTG